MAPPLQFVRLMTSTTLRIRDIMTESPHSIGAEQVLAVAHQKMREHRIRHLPVLRGGRLVGILSQRDLHLMETFRDVDPNLVPVEDAMSPEVYCVSEEDDVAKVATHMAEHRFGSAVVMKGPKVVGLVTTVDALRTLADVLSRGR